MKMKLRTRLILSYTTLSIALVFSLLFASNMLLERQFKDYMIDIQEKRNNSYVSAVIKEFENNSQLTPLSFLSLGEKALDEGIILMVNDAQGNPLFCMSCYDSNKCESMLISMRSRMEQRYPNFNGQYTEKNYPLTINDNEVGSVTLGYFGPYYLLDADIEFMVMLNRLLIFSGIVFFFLAFIFGVLMALRIAKPISEVTRKTKLIEQGELDSKIEIKSNINEIQTLIASVQNLSESLKNQQALKKRMASDYAHEFRTPLAAIQSNLEGIIDGIFEPTNERLESLRAEVLRLSNMVCNIEKIVDMENKNDALHKELFFIDDLLNQVVTTFEAQANEKNISLTTTLAHCQIYADRDKIGSVVSNLISNAIKYTNNHGNIYINLKELDNRITFEIEDTGIGISNEDLPYIFEYLYRADISRTRNTGGSGIGLSVVKSIIELHRGEIAVTSELNKGSQFVVTLPKN